MLPSTFRSSEIHINSLNIQNNPVRCWNYFSILQIRTQKHRDVKQHAHGYIAGETLQCFFVYRVLCRVPSAQRVQHEQCSLPLHNARHCSFPPFVMQLKILITFEKENNFFWAKSLCRWSSSPLEGRSFIDDASHLPVGQRFGGTYCTPHTIPVITAIEQLDVAMRWF